MALNFDPNDRDKIPWFRILLGAVVVVILITLTAIFWPTLSGSWNDPAKREQVQHVPIGEIPIALTKTPSPRVQSSPPAQAVASTPTEGRMAPEAPPQQLFQLTSARARVASPARAVMAGSCKPGNTGQAFNWRVSGANPYARSEAEAFSDVKLDQMLTCFSVKKEHWAEIKRKVRDTSNGRSITLKPGDAVGDMMFGNGQMVANVVVQIPGGQRGLLFELEMEDGTRYDFVVPLGCWNWTLMRKASLPPCPRYEQQVQKGDFVVVKIKGPAWQKKGCEPRVRIAGTSTWVPPHTLPACLRAFGLNCELGGNARYQFAYEALGDGTTVLELPAIVAEDGSGYEIVTCNVRLKQGSCGVITKPKHFRFDARRATKVATVYDKGRIPKDLARSHWDQTWRNGFDNCPVRPD